MARASDLHSEGREFESLHVHMSKYSKEELEQLILVDNLSYEEIGRRYGVTGAAIKKAAKRLGIELPVNKDKNVRYCIVCNAKLPSENKKFCSYKCQQEYAYTTYINRWKQGLELKVLTKFQTIFVDIYLISSTVSVVNVVGMELILIVV